MWKKRLAAAALALTIGEALVVSGCKSKIDPDVPDPQAFDYDGLYRTEQTDAYAVVQPGCTTKASFGYTQKTEQGYNGWYYLGGHSGKYARMTCTDGTWVLDDAEICGAVLRPGKKTAAVRQYLAQAEGEVTLYGNYKCADADSAGAAVRIYQNDRELYRGNLAAGDTVGHYYEITISLQKGDELYFQAQGDGAAVCWNPVVDYEGLYNTSLYHRTEMGKYYGDVFPYYDEKTHTLYMGFLWSDDARNDEYHNALEISQNMLTFTDIPEANNYDIWQHYKENGRLHFLYNPNHYYDRSKYALVRDNMVYFDEERQRFLMVAGCYYAFNSVLQTSDLVIYESEDAMGFRWNPTGNVVESGYSRNLPECPTLMKIGDRWYVFVSVAYKTAHQVGPLQYWTGDPGVDCMDVDWGSKEFSFLDGEDLCAARPVPVGDKVYLWGWIPNTYDTMPWAPWAGYLNLPREVIQLENGSLGSRLDPGLSRLLNYGKIYTLGSGNYGVEQGSAEELENGIATMGETKVFLGAQYCRNYVTMTIDMKNSDMCGYVMRQDGREFETWIVRENGKTYLKILSPGDPKHAVNSVIEIQDLHNGVFDVKLVCDGPFVEFFVNDEYALTAHTSMTDAPYGAYLYASGNASFRNVAIHKLISYTDVSCP